ncbi:MAG: hypothetical protein KDC53_12260 [Saprospiraceae bacterium]|nr:hypothetical protein [Saprospiraceae bacterium]
MKIEFSTCHTAIRWLLINTRTEVDFQTLREQLDINYLHSGQFYVHMTVPEDYRSVIKTPN